MRWPPFKRRSGAGVRQRAAGRRSGVVGAGFGPSGGSDVASADRAPRANAGLSLELSSSFRRPLAVRRPSFTLRELRAAGRLKLVLIAS